MRYDVRARISRGRGCQDANLNREQALANARDYIDSGALHADLARRVAYRTESQDAASAPILRGYLADELAATVARLGFAARVIDNPEAGAGPMLIAERLEGAELPTVLVYGHGDVVRGYDAQWRRPLAPWSLTVEGDRWYGRGTADNKGQHSIVLGGLQSTLAARGGRLGFNVKLLIETGEEVGSPGLHAVCSLHKGELEADALIASDGPRLAAQRPTLFLGSRGSINFDLELRLREGGHHSGNWGGLLRNPATVLANAIASMIGKDGAILVEGLRPPPIPDDVRRALSDISVGGDAGDPEIDAGWGERGLTPAERVFGWNTLEVLAMKSGNADHPVNAIPPSAVARCQLRFVVGTEWRNLAERVRAHLSERGFADIEITVEHGNAATRLSPDHPWVRWAAASIERTTGKRPAILPNLGGTLPNDVFAELLGLPTLWVPHSYPGCSQHAANEHLLASVAREGLEMMAGLFWDLGDPASAPARVRSSRRA
jgi:acetylornithine deacetylase/succinyl-diaminopimelate desuccinylase-like protein